MKKINKKYFLGFLTYLTYGKTVLAQFQSSSPETIADLPTTNALDKFLHFTNVGLALVFIFSLLFLIISGVSFITAGGDEPILETAHKMWRLAALGLTVALIGYIIINLIKYFI